MMVNRNYAGAWIVVLIAVALSSCSKKSYCVSQSGNDLNPGTKRKPLKTITKVNSLSLLPGDKILFKGGETFEGTLTVTLPGTSRKPVVVGSYGDGMATIDAKDKEAIIARGAHFTIQNLHALGSGRKEGNTTNGIALINTHHALVEHIETEGFQKSGLDLYNTHTVTVRNVHAFNNGFSGINISGDDVSKSKHITLRDCLAENNPGDPTALTNHSGNGILVGQSDSVLIDHCVATNNGWDMPRVGNGPVGIWAYEADHVVIQYCISYKNKTAKGAKDGGGFDLDGGVRNSIIQYCLSYQNEGAGYGLFQYEGATDWSNNIVRYCVSIDDATSTAGSGGIFVWNGSPDSSQLSNAFVYNNLVYSRHAPAVSFEPSSKNQNLLFVNNIFIGAGDILHGPASGEKFAGNVWWNSGSEAITFRGYNSLKAWSVATGSETLNQNLVGLQVDPLLIAPFPVTATNPYALPAIDGFKLRPASPLKDKGISYELFGIPLPFTDFYGTSLSAYRVLVPGVHQLQGH